MCECVCAWCPVMDWRPIQGVFPPHAQCSQDRLQIHSIPEKDKAVTKTAYILNSPVVCVNWLEAHRSPTRLLDHVTVLIGIAYKGKAIAGVINQPFYNYQAGAGATLGRTLWGILGLGAFGFQLQEVPEGKRIITTTRSHSNKLVTDAVQAMDPHDVIRVGGAGNKIIQLVEGKASAYVFASPGCKKWDTCATEAILHAVGGKLTDMHGNAYRYDAEVKHMNSAGVLATLRNHQFYASRVPQSVLKALQSD
ncbi:3'(2'),5'-bisphosphate nucleotidase 1 isoform X3 [Pangasianodon hypophthalmus]|uniref:3'(2'),5'-bisphosphate nucleotidase 1 isoform X3 n=1 Tax=Pangasianodon hypophthalmus TaxID=310915 RepID=UPI002307D5FF|nr:3'(2'),5'-bisphosphate nucleotidase 1 isoform X3 [Pangasianodon hypophthalmus]